MIITQNEQKSIIIDYENGKETILPTGVTPDKFDTGVRFLLSNGQIAQQIDVNEVTSVTDINGITTVIGGDNDLFFNTLRDSFFFSPAIKWKTLIDAASPLANQQPTAVDTQLQVTFGAAQGTASDPVQLLTDGTWQINRGNRYKVFLHGHFGRIGSAQVSELRFYGLLNGTQIGQTYGAKIDGVNAVSPLNLTVELDLPAGSSLTFDLLRDSTGNNSGGLFSLPATLATVGDVPCVRGVIACML